jgi:hypothetical protein
MESVSEVRLPAFEGEVPKPKIQPGRKFHHGNELGTQDALGITSTRYAHLIAVLGSSDAGKTCFLSSLYLMASGGALPSDFEFAGSETLQAFDDRARGLREWQNGQLPSQLVDHTFLSDKRQPSLLHLSIREAQVERRRFDLLLTDLPGEWTDNLVLKASNAESFKFLHRADGIILMVDGNRLMSDERHADLQHMRYFTDRLANDVGVSKNTPFIILVSKCDEIAMQMPPTADELRAHVESLGFPATVILSAAFSRNPDEVASGTGVFSAVQTILSHLDSFRSGSHINTGRELTSRTFQNFRG